MATVSKKRSGAKPPAIVRPSAASPVQHVRDCRFQLWEAYDMRGITVGYLVTLAGDIDHPIGAAIMAPGGDAEDAYRTAVHFVGCIGQHGDPWGAIAASTQDTRIAGFDLTSYGEIDSLFPMPAWIYGLNCRPIPIVAGRLEGDLPRAEQLIPVQPRPWCRFMQWTMEERFQIRRELVTRNHRYWWEDLARYRLKPYAIYREDGKTQQAWGVGVYEGSDRVGCIAKLQAAKFKQLQADLICLNPAILDHHEDMQDDLRSSPKQEAHRDRAAHSARVKKGERRAR